ncbi:hypothetical protein BV898_15307 [Hypsibius exemplaris]|uniref:Uncharacterized protein n=1 Tax=Hypsibius exemplaris TaxID=2072580 RepID=A0A9X6NBB8_HYPEX|nr:hypothetical protein BV898_15307 [Hypsibius exemplaris]
MSAVDQSAWWTSQLMDQSADGTIISPGGRHSRFWLLTAVQCSSPPERQYCGHIDGKAQPYPEELLDVVRLGFAFARPLEAITVCVNLSIRQMEGLTLETGSDDTTTAMSVQTPYFC